MIIIIETAVINMKNNIVVCLNFLHALCVACMHLINIAYDKFLMWLNNIEIRYFIINNCKNLFIHLMNFNAFTYFHQEFLTLTFSLNNYRKQKVQSQQWMDNGLDLDQYEQIGPQENHLQRNQNVSWFVFFFFI